MLEDVDRRILGDLYLSQAGRDFVEQFVEKFGSRFGGSAEEQQAAEFLQGKFRDLGADKVWLETFTCPGWTRHNTELVMTAPARRAIDCIALPYCPPGEVEGPLTYLGDGDPQTFAAKQNEIRGSVVMVTTAAPRYFHRKMHRCEKLARALDAGATGFIWMRAAAGGLPETGSARFGRACEVPAVSVSFEAGSTLLRTGRGGPVRVRIVSTNENHTVTSHNVVAEFTGRQRPAETIVLGSHYDGHDISQSAMDNAAGLAVLLEAARALAPHKQLFARSVRCVAFAQEEMGLHGGHDYATRHRDEPIRFMLNLDGSARTATASLELQGWPEGVGFLNGLMQEMFETDVAVGDQIGLYADMYAFAAHGIPAATLKSDTVGSSTGASRGYGHTPLDSLDKVAPKLIQLDALRTARLAVRLAGADEIPLRRKSPEEMRAVLRDAGLDQVLRLEGRPVPGEA